MALPKIAELLVQRATRTPDRCEKVGECRMQPGVGEAPTGRRQSQARRAFQQPDGCGQKCVDLRDDLRAIGGGVGQQRRKRGVDEVRRCQGQATSGSARGVVMRAWSTKTVELSCWLASLARRTSLAAAGRDCVSSDRRLRSSGAALEHAELRSGRRGHVLDLHRGVGARIPGGDDIALDAIVEFGHAPARCRA